MPKLPSGQHVDRLQVSWRPVEACKLKTQMTDAIAASEHSIVGAVDISTTVFAGTGERDQHRAA